MPPYYSRELFLFLTDPVALEAGNAYVFSAKFLASKNTGSSSSPKVAWAVIYGADNPSWLPAYKLNSTLFSTFVTPTLFGTGPNVTSVSNSTETAISATLTPSISVTYPAIIIRLAFANSIGDGSWAVEFQDLSLSRSAQPWPQVELQTGASEKAVIPKVPMQFDPNPRRDSDCPHRKSSIRHFHDPSIWPGSQIPDPSTPLVLPGNTSVLISSCSLQDAVYAHITVPATSELIFADAPISLRIRSLLVEGKLIIGSETCRLNSLITITFVGTKTLNDEIATGFGAKGMGVVRAGSVDIHGFQYHPTWTRIASTIRPNDFRVYLQDTVNWEVGQKIVVVTSIFKDYEEDQNEVVTITSISDDGRIIEVTPPFSFIHYGGSEYQSEVGLLSRRITIQGDAQSDNEMFGGHIMVMGEGRFSGINFFKMGQRNMLARYPVHWHLIGSAPTSFAKDNTFWSGFYRCVSIHATHDTTVLRNVAWNSTAHCYYLEEGVEENNTISFNLAVHIRCIGPPMVGVAQNGETYFEDSVALLPADRAAAGFYITNAYNTFIGNAASGGWAGYSFPNLPTPLGFNKDINFSPQKRSLKIFDGNTVHSSGYHFSNDGGCIYTGGKLWYNAGVLTYDSGRYSRPTSLDARKNGQIVPDWMKFTNTKAWLCQLGSQKRRARFLSGLIDFLGISHWGERAEVSQYEGHDVIRSVQTFGESWFYDSLVNIKSSAPVGLPSDSINRAFQFYDVRLFFWLLLWSRVISSF